ncbi:MAG: ABC transporter ATP-binding protein [Paracoccaceae bacterium]
MSAEHKSPVLEAENLSREYGTVKPGRFFQGRRGMRAVDAVSLSVEKGRTLAIVGESGCGKSTLLRSMVTVDDLAEGSVRYNGRDVATMSKADRQTYRREVQMVFQDPTASLNPRRRIEDIIGEPIRIHFGHAPKSERIEELMQSVGLDPSRRRAYPAQFSGGQRQRISIARALAVEPRVMLFDEPVAALDVSIQAQILNLLVRIRAETGVASLFVSHDLSVVRYIAHDVVVMYLGKVVEHGPVDRVFDAPAHPYTRALLSAVPRGLDGREGQSDRILLQGEPPDPSRPPSGCRFNPRCLKAQALCRTDQPLPRAVDATAREVACHFPEAMPEVAPLPVQSLKGGLT